MKQTRPWLLALFVSLLCVCFLSVSAFADGGDEDPWDADNGSGGTNGDLGGGDNGGTTGYLLKNDVLNPSTGDGYSNLYVYVSLQLFDFIYGSNDWTIQTTPQVSKERSASVNWRSYGSSSVR